MRRKFEVAAGVVIAATLGAAVLVNLPDATTEVSAQPAASTAPVDNVSAPTTQQLLISKRSMWRYWDRGPRRGKAWTRASYNDAAWRKGRTPMGYGNRNENTTLRYGSKPKRKPITTYYRHDFLADRTDLSALTLKIRRDDGARVFVNGQLVFKTGLPAGRITPKTRAKYADDDGETWQRTSIDPNLLSAKNVIAVDVHQSSRSSSDVVFDLRLTGTFGGTGTGPTPTNPGPTPTNSIPPTSAPPPPDTNARVYVAADIGQCGGKMGAVANLLTDGTIPVITPGDMAYPSGTAKNFADCYDPYFGAFKDRTFPVPGNHEYITDGIGYRQYFGARVGSEQAPWYSSDFGNWHFLMLNSNCSDVGGCKVGSPQYEWAAADLAAHPQACVAAVWHHPRYSSGAYGNDPAMKDMWGLLQSNGADLVLSGHEHIYERFARANSDGTASDSGMRQFIVGTGGASLYPLGKMPNPLTENRNNQTHGVLRLDLSPTGYSWNFAPIVGGTFTDSGSDSC